MTRSSPDQTGLSPHKDGTVNMDPQPGGEDLVPPNFPSRQARFLLVALCMLVVAFLIWAAWAQVEEITRGQGQVVPSQEIQVVQSLEGGVLQDLLVREGELVKKGQVLARIRDIQFSSEERGTEAQFLSLSLKKERLSAEATGEVFAPDDALMEKAPQITQNETDLYKSRQKELQNAYTIFNEKIEKAKADLSEVEAQIEKYTQNRALLNKELDITRKMVRQRAMPELEQIRLERELSDISGEIKAQTQRKASLQAQLKQAQTERKGQEDKFRSEALEDLNEVQTKIKGLKEDLISIGDRVDRAALKSPVDGVVNHISLTTIGGVVEPAMRFIEIVPVDDALKIIAKVKPEEVAFIRPGNPAKVKITAYDPQKYGALNGTLTRIGASSVTDRNDEVFFEIEVRTDKNYMGTQDNPMPITPGMIADVEIITGKRSILDYVLKPFYRAKERAFTER